MAKAWYKLTPSEILADPDALASRQLAYWNTLFKDEESRQVFSDMMAEASYGASNIPKAAYADCVPVWMFINLMMERSGVRFGPDVLMDLGARAIVIESSISVAPKKTMFDVES